MTESPKRMPYPLLFGMVWIFLVSVVTSAVHAVLWPGDLPSDFSPGSVVRAQAASEGIAVLSLPDILEAVTHGSHVVLDARSRDEYAQDQLPGAMSLPISDFEAGMVEMAGFLEPSMPLVTYCTGPDCDDALQLALRLREAGFRNVSVYVGGLEEWRAKAP